MARPASPDASQRRRRRAIHVLIANDQVMLREALARVLEAQGFGVSGLAENGRRAVALTRERAPDVVVLSASMPVMDGLDAAREIRRIAPRVGIVLLTRYAEDSVVHDALRIGVRGFVLEAQGVVDLLQAIRDVSRGAIYISPCYSRHVLQVFARGGGPHAGALTPRETDVLRLIVAGNTMRQTATTLAISVRTAEWHRASLMGKLALRDTASLVRYAIRQGLIVA